MPELPNFSCERGWQQKFKNALVIILFALSTSLELDLLSKPSTEISDPCTGVAMVLPEDQRPEGYNHPHALAMAVAPILHFSEPIGPDVYASLFNVTRLDGTCECEGVPSDLHLSPDSGVYKRWLVDIINAYTFDDTSKVGLIFAGKLKVSLNYKLTGQLGFLVDETKERKGDLENIRIVLEENTETGAIRIIIIIIKHHGNGWKEYKPESINCFPETIQPQLWVSGRKHANFASRAECDANEVARFGPFGANSDNCSQEGDTLNTRKTIKPRHYIGGDENPIMQDPELLGVFGEGNDLRENPHVFMGERGPQAPTCKPNPQSVASED